MRTLLLILVILLAAWFLSVHYGFSVQDLSGFAPLPNTQASVCGLTVSQPLPGTSVSYQIDVRGSIDHARGALLGCGWATFEGQGGTAEVLDGSGARLAGPVPIPVADWTATTTDFDVQLDLLVSQNNASLPEGDHLTIHMVPENPSGRPSNTYLDIPVILRK